MVHRPFRLFLIKFIGLWGGHNIKSKLDEHTKSDTDIDKILNIRCDTHHHDEVLPKTDVTSAVETSRRKIVNLLLEKGIPGLTICVSKNNRVVWRTAFGFCDVENQVACNYDSEMRIGSVSKSIFVSAVVGPMLDAGKLNLDSSIHQYLSAEEFPKKKFNGQDCDITVRQLLSHTSGIRHYDNEVVSLRPLGSKGSKKITQCEERFNRTGYYQRDTFRDVVEALKPFKDDPLASEPGKFHYTTYGYVLLSAVMQKILQGEENQKDEQIQDFWIKVLRRNWRMENTYLDEDEVLIPRRARYYERTNPGGDLMNVPYTDNSIKWAGGGLVSTTLDLVRFGNILIDCYKDRRSEPMKRKTVEFLWERKHSSNYASGFSRLNRQNWRESEKLVVYHTGVALGASSILLIYPETEIVVAILVNLHDVNLTSLALSIADEFEKCIIAGED